MSALLNWQNSALSAGWSPPTAVKRYGQLRVDLVVRAAKAWSRAVMRDLKEKGYSRREVLHGEVDDLPAEDLRLLRMVAGGWEPK